MPFTKDRYPQSMKNMMARVRNKAISIVNALLEEGRPEASAIAIATDKAKEWAESRDIQVFKQERAASRTGSGGKSGTQGRKTASTGTRKSSGAKTFGPGELENDSPGQATQDKKAKSTGRSR